MINWQLLQLLTSPIINVARFFQNVIQKQFLSDKPFQPNLQSNK